MERNEILKLAGFSDEMIEHLEQHEHKIQNLPFIDDKLNVQDNFSSWIGENTLIFHGNQNFSNALIIRTA